MAINFPATAGQATDGTFTYTVAGITYAWNGSSWAAAGAGASATNRSLFSVSQNSPAGGGTLAYDPNSGSFSYTPPALSGFLTTESDTLATVTGRGASTTNSLTVGGLTVDGAGNNVGKVTITDEGNYSQISFFDSGGTQQSSIQGVANNLYINSPNAFVRLNTYALFYPNGDATLNSGGVGNTTIGGTLTAGGLTYPTVNGSSGQVLTSDGTGNVTWGTPAGARTTAQVTNAIANEAVANTSLVTPKTYALIKVQTSHAAWVTLYSDTASRTADASRGINVDPLPGSGVLSEVITTGAQTQLITPGVICFNSAGTGTTYAKVVNKSGSTANLTVTLTYVVLES